MTSGRKTVQPRSRALSQKVRIHALLLLSAVLAGCTANATELVYQAADAAARTWIDVFLTEAVNQLAADAGAP
jgi:hypothetical protein